MRNILPVILPVVNRHLSFKVEVNFQCHILTKALLSYKTFFPSSGNFPAMQNPTTVLNVSVAVSGSKVWSLLFTHDLLFYFYYCAIWEKSFLQSITVEAFHCVIWEHNFLCAIGIMFFCRKDVRSLSSVLSGCLTQS